MLVIGQIIWPLKEANRICLSGDGTTVTKRKLSRTLTSWLMSVTKVKGRKWKERTQLPKLEEKSSSVCFLQIVQWHDCDSTNSSRLERHAALYSQSKEQYQSSSALAFASITHHNVQLGLLGGTHEFSSINHPGVQPRNFK